MNLSRLPIDYHLIGIDTGLLLLARLNNSTREHLHFLLLEIDQQLSHTQIYFNRPDLVVAERILSRAGYAENLRLRARRSLLAQMQRNRKSPIQFRLQSTENLVAELFRFSQLGRQAINDSSTLAPELFSAMPHKECSKLIRRLRKSLNKVEPALVDANSSLAIEIDEERRKLTQSLSKMLNKAVLDLGQHQRLSLAADVMFPIYALRQMINLLSNIAESILSANLGQRMNLSRYESLSEIAQDIDSQPESMQLTTIAETRSGSAISSICEKSNRQSEFLAVFKEGDRVKLKEERQSVESWHDIYPGLAPKILAYNKRGDKASILIEHLSGLTFERVVTEQRECAAQALRCLLKTLHSIWRATRTPVQARANHMQQLQSRLATVFQVHPEFNTKSQQLCGVTQLPLTGLIEQAKNIENTLQAPFSVYIHGDFNLDNIIYDPVEKHIHFIDLHRSRYMDYVQDVAVFMVSIYRLRILDTDQRSDLLAVAKQFYNACRRFAKKEGDESFELRLTLGLVRSFISSTRFILDPTLSKRMFLRATYLLNIITSLKSDKLHKFRLPLEELFVE